MTRTSWTDPKIRDKRKEDTNEEYRNEKGKAVKTQHFFN